VWKRSHPPASQSCDGERVRWRCVQQAAEAAAAADPAEAAAESLVGIDHSLTVLSTNLTARLAELDATQKTKLAQRAEAEEVPALLSFPRKILHFTRDGFHRSVPCCALVES
jgi:hypothetical protein